MRKAKPMRGGPHPLRPALKRELDKGSFDDYEIAEQMLRDSMVSSAENRDPDFEELIQNIIPANALDFMQQLYKHQKLPYGIRFEAAKTAISYESPKLAATTVQADVTMRHEDWLDKLGEE